MNYGKVIREMRKARGYSQEELVLGITSRTTLSSFENGSSRPTYQSVLEYLDKMNVHFDEFIFLSSKEKIMEKRLIADKVVKVVMSKKTKQIKSLIIELDELYTQTKDIFYRLNKAQLIILSNEFNLIKVVNVEAYKKDIFSHLDKVETWGKMEVSLFNNILFIIPSVYIKNIYNNSDKKLELVRFLYAMEKIDLVLLTNIITVFIKRGEYTAAKEFLLKINGYQENDLYHRTINIFQMNLIDYILEGDEEKLVENNKILNFLDLINAKKLSNTLEKFQSEI